MIKIKYILGNQLYAQDIKDYFSNIGCEGESFEFSDNAYFVNPDTKYVDFLRTDRWQFKALVEAGVFEELKYPYTESKPKLKVIKGVPGRGDEVINFLERLGGRNFDDCKGNSDQFYYYMRNNDPYIRETYCDSEYFNKFELEILTLPEKEEKPTLKVIQGVPNRGEEVIALLKAMGGTHLGMFGCFPDYYYFINKYGDIDCKGMKSSFFKKFNLEIISLPEKKKKRTKSYDESECVEVIYSNKGPMILEPFVSKVLVRIGGVTRWIPGIYVCQKEIEGNNVYVIAGNLCEFDECIPYEGNEHLVLTMQDPE